MPTAERQMRRNARPRASRLRGIDRVEASRAGLPRQRANPASRYGEHDARHNSDSP